MYTTMKRLAGLRLRGGKSLRPRARLRARTAAGAILYAAEKATQCALDAHAVCSAATATSTIIQPAGCCATPSCMKSAAGTQRNPPHADRAGAVRKDRLKLHIPATISNRLSHPFSKRDVLKQLPTAPPASKEKRRSCRFIPPSIPNPPSFARNADVMRGPGCGASRESSRWLPGGGGETSRKRHTFARQDAGRAERVDLLVDPGHGLSRIVAAGPPTGSMAATSIPRASLPGWDVFRAANASIVANDATIKGGHLLSPDGEEASAARRISRGKNNLPCVYMVDSGGAFLPMQDEIFPDERHFRPQSSTTRRRCPRRAFRRSRS